MDAVDPEAFCTLLVQRCASANEDMPRGKESTIVDEEASTNDPVLLGSVRKVQRL